MSSDCTKSTLRHRALNENEKKFFNIILHGTLDEFNEALTQGNIDINCCDEYGSTPLQQAAFKGNVEMCKVLLKAGSQVNHDEHEHGYTALMFAALSGNPDLCQLLLEHGARPDKRNKVNRTASEMAAFTGQHRCVSTINNFVNMQAIDCYAKPVGSNLTSKIDSSLVPLLYQLTITYNIHPVKTILFICENPCLLENEKGVLFVLEDLMEKNARGKEINEIMSFKLHIILSTFKSCYKFLKSIKEDTEKTDREKLISYAKNLLLAKEQNFPKMLELFVRQCVKEYPFRESAFFKQLVATLAKTEIGSSPSAIYCVQQMIIGQRMMSDELFCSTCGQSNATKRCSSCKMVNYCNSECQKFHWFTHKNWCRQLTSIFQKRMQASKVENN